MLRMFVGKKNGQHNNAHKAWLSRYTLYARERVVQCPCRLVTSTDATVGFDPKATDAATEIVWPIFASHVTTVAKFIAGASPKF